jgi:hypothetical protein
MAYTVIMPEDLRAAFQHALETFEKAVAERWDYSQLVAGNVERGICDFLSTNYGDAMTYKFHNGNFDWVLRWHDEFRFPWPFSQPDQSIDENILNALIPRIDFLKEMLNPKGISW